MQKTTRAVLTAVTVLIATPNIASAESWICEHSNLVREINVERETGEPAAAPSETAEPPAETGAEPPAEPSDTTGEQP